MHSAASRKKPVIPWALWDAGSSSFNAVMTTFVFTVYLTSEAFGSTEHTTQVLSAGLTAAGVVVAVTAPITGQRADRSGSRRLSLAWTTGAVGLFVALCFLARPEPSFLYLGVGLIAAANVFSEIATVHYNSLLPSISTPETVGRVSGLGWSFGYFGGIVALAIVLVGFVSPRGVGDTREGFAESAGHRAVLGGVAPRALPSAAHPVPGCHRDVERLRLGRGRGKPRSPRFDHRLLPAARPDVTADVPRGTDHAPLPDRFGGVP